MTWSDHAHSASNVLVTHGHCLILCFSAHKKRCFIIPNIPELRSAACVACGCPNPPSALVIIAPTQQTGESQCTKTAHRINKSSRQKFIFIMYMRKNALERTSAASIKICALRHSATIRDRVELNLTAGKNQQSFVIIGFTYVSNIQ